jgi:hypothetical protein
LKASSRMISRKKNSFMSITDFLCALYWEATLACSQAYVSPGQWRLPRNSLDRGFKSHLSQARQLFQIPSCHSRLGLLVHICILLVTIYCWKIKFLFPHLSSFRDIN